MIDGSNVCAMNANLSEMSAANPYFGPLIDNGYAPTETANGGDKKYGNFTSELHTFFRYNGAATLEFTGDDDVWAFVNNKLFVDLGGMRSETNKSSTIKASTCTFQNKDNKTVALACDPDFDLYEDGLYDLHVFQAERCDFGSNYKLTLDGFLNTGKSTCLAELKTCGNNVLDLGEECDVVNGFVNYAAGFSSIAYGCSAGCKAQFCGDGIVQPERGEECDLASSNSNNGQCSLSCKLPRCGDSVVQIWLGEVCDDGINDGSYGYCGSDCTYLPPRCGDGVVDRSYGEICDDGLNTGAYNTCNPDCTLPAHCGDKIIQEEFESCDDGEENGQPGVAFFFSLLYNPPVVCFVSGGHMRNRSLWVVGISCLLLYGCSDDSSGVSASGSVTPEPVVGEAECGNRIVETGEICDDGNTVSNDGCSADCKSVEEGYECSKTGGSCTKINKPQPDKCGNQLLDENEACDDGNTTGGDGCSADCSTVEDNYICNRVGRPCIPAGCGNSVTDGNEECDDGPESNVEYTQQNLSLCNPECKWAHYCGDNKLDAVDIANGEECDNGGIDTSNERNGCSADCKRVNYCGDGIVDKTAGEDCDDDNNTSGDGCSDACNIETGFSCIVEHGKSVCSPIACGNGVLDADKGESCDDHNRLSNDGCAANCQIETGYRCTQNGEGLSVCENTCGNGIVDADVGETCDDGKSIAGDGCSDKCRVEPGYICPEQGKPCFARACGDGLLAGNEECDDGNDVSGDGCSKQCRRESGFVCREPNKPCVHTECGDSKVEGDETCDEGSNEANHTAGCVDCQIQMGWQCLAPGSACTHDATCGNGVLEGAEECDEGSDEANHTAGCVGKQMHRGLMRRQKSR